MARTIRPVASANLSDKERAAARARTKRKITALRRAARMLSSQEARALPSAKRGRARAPSETQEDTSDSETEEDESASATRSAPPASSGYARECAAAHRLLWRWSRRREAGGQQGGL